MQLKAWITRCICAFSEARIKAVEAQILSICPDFYSRSHTAVSKLGETLPVAVKLDKADGDFPASQYLERLPKKIGHSVKFITNKVGKIMSIIMQFIGLEIINGEFFGRIIINEISHYC